MKPTNTVRARIDRKTAEAAAILASIGLTVSDALRLMLLRTAAEKALPFEPLVPSAETIATIEAVRRGELVAVGDLDSLMAELHADDEVQQEVQEGLQTRTKA